MCHLQVHLACPQTLLPVLPLLTHELQLEVEAKRLAAIDLLGKLFTLPGSDMDQEYGYLFEEFLRRCKDQKVELDGLLVQRCLLGKGGEGGDCWLLMHRAETYGCVPALL